MAVLRILEGAEPNTFFNVTRKKTTLGRNPECDIMLDPVDISRKHVTVHHDGEVYSIEDLGSRNGTFVNSRRLEPHVPHRLVEGDIVKMCKLVFVFESEPFAMEGQESPTKMGVDSQVIIDDRPAGSTIMKKVNVSAGYADLTPGIRPEEKLRALMEISRSLGRAMTEAEVLPKIIESLFGIFPQADRGMVVLRDRESGKLVPKAIRHRREEDSEMVRLTRTVIDEVMQTGEAILSADASSDPGLPVSDSIVELKIRSMMCAPLIGPESSPLGVIQIDALNPYNRFSDGDLELLAGVACQIAIAIENAQFREVVMRERALELQLKVAHDIQKGFLPAGPPELEGYSFFDYYQPANILGGDYFDYIPLEDGRMAVVLADVSGKGIPAALLVAKLNSEIRYCLAGLREPAEVMRRLNRVFCESRWESQFITMVLAVLDPEKHEVVLTNAGHMSPILRNERGVRDVLSLDDGGLPLGVTEDAEYEEHRVALAVGDHLVLFSDGITEAMNSEGALYDKSRLQEILRIGSTGATKLGWRIIDDVKRFAGNQTQSDDICLTCFGRVDETASGSTTRNRKEKARGEEKK
jgi:serine phosphatase RsbU (regulator of sigma subunit)/pSer/pThr/pTyr-binding forkhead associated (FHA) protein